MLTPCRITTRPSASVIQRPEWPSGAVGAACATEQSRPTSAAAAAVATALLAPGTPPVCRSGLDPGVAQRLGERRDLGGMGLDLGLAAGVGDAGEDPAAVVVADVAADVAVVLEPLHEAGEGALAQMDLLGQLLNPAVTLGVVGEAPQHLVFAQGQPVL